ncbi:MAG: ABC transporter substrate-binding protein [Litorilinea sp.]
MPARVSRRDFLRISGGVTSIALLSACAGAVPAGPSDSPSTEPLVIRYAGLESMGSYVELYLQPWLEENNVTLERGSFGQQELTDKIMQSVATQTYLADVFQFPSNARADVIGANALMEVPEEVLDAIDIDDILPSAQNTLKWDDRYYSLPYDGDIHYYAFRKDLFADPEINQRFHDQYGYDLSPENGAVTWSEWRDIGEFFTGWDWNGNGEDDDFGLACMTQRGDTAWWGFHSRATAYAKHPDDPGYFMDTQTGEARLNSPGFVRALTEWIEENESWAPPGGIGFTYADSANAMNGGRVAQTYNWDAVTGSSNPDISVIKGLQGYNILPGSHEVYNARAGEWDSFDEPSHAPYHAFGGWVLAVSAQVSPDIMDSVWDMMTHVTNPEGGLWFVTRYTGASPYRYSQFENIEAFVDGPMGLGEEVAADYLQAAQETFAHPNYVTDLAMPGWVQYRDALELAVARALAREVPPQQALDDAKAAFDEVSERMGGLEQQAEIYRRVLGI